MDNEQSTCIKLHSNESEAEYHWRLVTLSRETVADAAETLREGGITECDRFRKMLRGKRAGSKMKLCIIHSYSGASLVKKKKKYKVKIQGYLEKENSNTVLIV